MSTWEFQTWGVFVLAIKWSLLGLALKSMIDAGYLKDDQDDFRWLPQQLSSFKSAADLQFTIYSVSSLSTTQNLTIMPTQGVKYMWTCSECGDVNSFTSGKACIECNHYYNSTCCSAFTLPLGEK
ncbi:uncharacterized protein FPRO_09136 [Fusarium proliferatum ET1]|uniref:Uncharacterized protein n=1 Tax=Fusarium proliferatum (strain ET1) TaxID=1227346 RepID=A0A1L7VQ76_FUSPR|nr:uncharacterized protein FPRO_09136 [Fusarium proliferatum ET1]CZR41835.1 uncharacterized protein FPRO_09136 [Fusarium proliferatum ET1]